jgi:hypothetical protein
MEKNKIYPGEAKFETKAGMPENEGEITHADTAIVLPPNSFHTEGIHKTGK